MGYVSLHNHSFGSLRDGFSSPKEMAEQAARYHQSAISITDHGSVSMIPQFYQECIAAGVKPILGNEMYICSDVTLKDRTYHLIVLAKNNIGYKNLLKLDTISHENYYRRPRIDMNILKQHKEGLVITSACMGSWWNTEQAEERTKEFKDIFGDDFYLELQANSWDDQKVYNDKIMSLAKEFNVKLIITTDSHVPTREMCKYQHMWNAIGKSQAFYTTEDFYIMGEQEIISRMSKDIPMDILRDAIDNTQEIADKCNVTIEVTGDNYPKYPCDNQKEKIKELCRVGWKQKVSGKIPRELWDTYVTQFNHEMDVLDKCNYYNILLITWDYIRYARDNDILVGPSRGCFLPDSMVLMSNGTTKKISEVSVGDTVISHTGNANTVMNVMKYKVNESMTTIHIPGQDIGCTNDHKILAAQLHECPIKLDKRQWCNSSCHRFDKCELKQFSSDPQWVEAKHIKPGDFVCYPKPKLGYHECKMIDLSKIDNRLCYDDSKVWYEVGTNHLINSKTNRFIAIDSEFAYLAGLFIGNGWAVSDRCAVGFAMPTKSHDKLENINRMMGEIFGLTGHFRPNKKGTCCQLIFYSRAVNTLFHSLFGDKALHKHIPDILMTNDVEITKGVLRGLMHTDGHLISKDNKINYSSISYDLINQFILLMASIGYKFNVTKRVHKNHDNWCDEYKANISGRDLIRLRDDFLPEIMYKGNLVKKDINLNDNYYYTKVQSVGTIDSYDGYVYDLSVENDTSYIVNTAIVHNSSAGSLVCYLMGITDVDPIEHRLVFERFVNEERVTPGDIDVDFEDIHRDDIVTYIKQKYGKVFPVRTFGYLGEKGAIQKAGMALHMEPKVYMSISKGADSISDIKGYPELVEVANAFNGRLYNFSAHASAVMIFPGPVEDFCSIEKQGDTYVASYDAHVLESYNMLKCDILGLRNLSVIHDTLTLIGKKMDVYRLPHDHEVYQKLANGYTMGTFQIESKMMQGLCKDIHIDSFDDLANILALGRPGPLDSGLTQQYIDAKKTGEVPKLHPIVDKILESTFGAMIFQEDMLLIAREYAGYSVGEADVLRKTIGRKELDKIDAVVAEFIQRCDSINRPHDVSVRLGEILKACGRYLFSKNHSYAYCTISNTTAWLAKYYSREYFCSTLNSVIDDHEKSVVYLAELKRLKIPVYPPDLSIGNRKWTLESDGIRMGLEYIKGVGKNLNTEHTETFEAVVESNTKTCVIPCIKAGALDYLKLSRAVMLAKFAGTQESLKRVQECQEKIEKYAGDPKKLKLLEQWQEKLKAAQEITQVTPEKYDMIAGECEVLSFSFHEIPKVKTGEVTNVFKKNDKNSREMAWVTIKTTYGDFRCTVFADGWAKVGALVKLGESYKFVVNNQGILEELQVDDKVIKVNERKYKKTFDKTIDS